MDTVGQSKVERLVRRLNLQPHPSGSGVFSVVWRAERQITIDGRKGDQADHVAGSTIYFLLEAPNVVKWHCNSVSDAIVSWNAGEKVKFHMLHKDGSYTYLILGDVVTYPECTAQLIIPHDTWYAIELTGSTGFCLFTDITIPGFESEDWREGNGDDLVKTFPQHLDVIQRFV